MLISIVNLKGGVGKSTLAVHLASWLRDQQIRVALVDADRQGSAAQWLQRAEPHIPVHRLLAAHDLLKGLPALQRDCDVVLADSPAALGAEIAALITQSDLCLLPIGASMLDVWASYRVARMIYKVRFGQGGARPAAFAVLNRVVDGADVTRVAAAAVHNFGFPVALTPIRFREAYLEAAARGTVVGRLGPCGANAADEMHALFDEVLEISTRPTGPSRSPVPLASPSLSAQPA
jgi:chromosome partitioning protein